MAAELQDWRARQLCFGPPRRTGDPLVLRQARVALRDDLTQINLCIAPPGRDDVRMQRRPAARHGHRDNGRILDRGVLAEDCSTSSGQTFIPEGSTIKSFARPTRRRLPAPSMVARSPVLYQPSDVIAAAVRTGSAQYPRMTLEPRTRTSPSPARRTSTPVSALPTLPIGVVPSAAAHAIIGEHALAP